MNHAQATAIYQQGLEKVRTTPVPEGQKFPPGAKVRIKRDEMVREGTIATVEYTYAHAYWGDDVKSYSLKFENGSTMAWFDESQLEAAE